MKKMKKQTTLSKKRSDSIMGTIEKKYGKDFGISTDKELGDFLEKLGSKSLIKLLTPDRVKSDVK
jgi:hypothetical protein